MTRTLIVTFDAGGNFPPALGLAQRMVADGDEVLLLGHPGQRDLAGTVGVPFEEFRANQVYRPLARLAPPKSLAEITSTLASREIGREVVAVAQRYRPDVVVVDCLLVAALAASVRSGYRTVTLVHTLPSFWAGPFARGPVGVVTALRGTRMARAWRSAQGSLATVPPGFDSYTAGPFTDIQWVGSIAPQLAPTRPDQVVRAAGQRSRPRILISLSTIWFPGQDRTLQNLLDAVGGLDLDVVMTTGRSIDPDTLTAPANVVVHRFVDHDLLLPDVDLVVGHGGFGTTMRALRLGIPVLVLPGFDLVDQPLVGRRIAELGVGRTMSRRSPVPALRAAIVQLAAPGPEREAAAALGAQLRAADPAGAAATFVRQVAASALPV